mgnify:CR=1 FL=1
MQDSGDVSIAQIELLASTRHELGRVGHEKAQLNYIFLIEGQ